LLESDRNRALPTSLSKKYEDC